MAHSNMKLAINPGGSDGQILKSRAMSVAALAIAGTAICQEYGNFDGYTLRVKLIGGAKHQPLYTLIPQRDEATGATVEIP